MGPLWPSEVNSVGTEIIGFVQWGPRLRASIPAGRDTASSRGHDLAVLIKRIPGRPRAAARCDARHEANPGKCL